MKKCYVLIEETNLRSGGDEYDIERNTKVFVDFASAKEGMRSAIKSLATTHNKLFDGNGNILGLDDFLNEEFCEGYLEEEEEVEFAQEVPDILRKYFLGEEIEFKEDFLNKNRTCEIEISEWYMGWGDYRFNISGDSYKVPYRLYGMYHPLFIQVNSIHMDNPEKTYVCRISSECDECSQPWFVFVELREVYIE